MQYLFLVAYILVAAAGYTLKYLNLRHLERHGAEIPEEFACLIDGGLLKKTRDYTVENTRFGFLESASGLSLRRPAADLQWGCPLPDRFLYHQRRSLLPALKLCLVLSLHPL